jgi:hypothetical protein
VFLNGRINRLSRLLDQLEAPAAAAEHLSLLAWCVTGGRLEDIPSLAEQDQPAARRLLERPADEDPIEEAIARVERRARPNGRA